MTHISVAKRAAREAGKVIMKYFDKKLDLNFKKGSELVTNADKASERKLLSVIKKAYPSHAILSEESPEKKSPSPYRWIMDPIDGTFIFSHGIPLFGIALALEKDGEVIVGVNYFPALDWMYYAEKGKGAYFNGKKIHVSKRGKKDQKQYGFSSEFFRRPNAFKKVRKEAMKRLVYPKSFGSTAFDLSMVAHGKSEAYFSLDDKPWDIAAGMLIVREAGGKITNLKGDEATVNDSKTIASNGKLHSQLLKLI